MILPSKQPWLVLLVVGVGTFLSALASSTVTLALPVMGQELGISIEDASWVMLSYQLVLTIFLLVFGRIGDLIGLSRVYITGFVLFGAASLLCGFSDSFWHLIITRLLQGLGGSMILATGPALLTTSFPAHQRGKALGLLSTATYAGLTAGSPLGGLVISGAGWRWIFWYNVPVALLVVLLGLVFLPKKHSRSKAPMDFGGFFALVSGLPLLLLVITNGQLWGWTSIKTALCLLASISLLTFFIFVEFRHSNPMLNLGLFRSRILTGSVLSAICNYVGLFVPTILIPFYLSEGRGLSPIDGGLLLSCQSLVMAGPFVPTLLIPLNLPFFLEGHGLSPLNAGLLLSIQSMVMTMVALPSGWLSDRLGSRGLATTGMLILAGALLGFSTIGPETQSMEVALWLGLVGMGTGVFISPNSNALMSSVPADHQGMAGGILAVARNLGMLIGTAVATSIFHAMGGHTNLIWTPTEFRALQTALWMAAAVTLTGAVFSALRGNSKAVPVAQ